MNEKWERCPQEHAAYRDDETAKVYAVADPTDSLAEYTDGVSFVVVEFAESSGVGLSLISLKPELLSLAFETHGMTVEKQHASLAADLRDCAHGVGEFQRSDATSLRAPYGWKNYGR